ncbi:MAG: hypothetical protein MUO26_13740 [Methanotrichaceae archaeon]|nr:hypothetical protein [Methanotrichaceae archaeon]
MNDVVAVICSTADPASLNIAKHLLLLASWDNIGNYRTFRNFRLIIQEASQLTLNSLDERLKSLGLSPGMIVIASRHKSDSRIPWLGGHFTGKIENRKYELSTAAPAGLRSFLINICRIALAGYRISAEATHHGPSDIVLPSFFAEIGSCEEQWSDPNAGETVARAILNLDNRTLPVFLGFGGGHYVRRQTSLMFEANIAFGHLFSSYQLTYFDRELLKTAKSKSGANYAFIDRKSLKAKERDELTSILDEINLPLLRSKEIRTRFPI